LFAVARRFDVSVKELRRWNHLKSNHVRNGQKLVVLVQRRAAEPMGLAGPIRLTKPKAIPEEGKQDTAMVTQAPDSATEVVAVASQLTEKHVAKGKETTSGARTKENISRAPKQLVQQPKPIRKDLYEVQPGDTLWNIARRYEGLTVEKLMSLNGLKDKNLKVGMKLIIG
jgi:membrane-bound lytic murein transglycosylase D